MKTIALRHLAEINPPSPEFEALAADAYVLFLPLETVWSDSRADQMRRSPKALMATGYTRFQAGDTVCPKVTPTFQAGRSMRAESVGAGTTELHVLRPRPGIEPRWITYAVRSKHFLDEGVTAFQGVAGLQRVPPEFIANFRVMDASVDEQRRIADFLDYRVARIGQIIDARRQQQALLDASLVRASLDAIRGEGDEPRRPSGLSWLGSIPSSWPLLTVSTEFQVDLGKMLDEKRQTGKAAIPYLRNTNVQWDNVDLSDLKQMDIGTEERERYCVHPGDLLICEGGQPGRSAVWRGEMAPLGFQKALHRARTRGRSRVEWLLECLRVAVHLNVFAVENGQTTIGHLTNEQLRAVRFPFPETDEQDRILRRLHARQAQIRGTGEALGRSTELLQEYKQSLITAAVTGELDVTTGGSGIPG